MPIDFKRVKDIFLAAVEKANPEERAACLREACGDDEALRAHVEALLHKHEQAGSFLESPAVDPAATVGTPPPIFTADEAGSSAAPPEAVGSRIGPYKLLQHLGEGGMGNVWVAEQQEPVKRRVALKVIKPGMDSVQVLRRFEAERQALAMMDHTNIAKVLDAGATSAGRPYFVMELVKGVPITKYCDELHLTLRERLALFVPVCQAIQHAHQKGIIHRDIKPSNVLVAVQDGKPVAKVIDFGVAKALHQRLTDESLYTEMGQIIGTLEYMSPEQAELSALDIDTRADVYALGVLLYELLTGSTPISRDRLRTAAFTEMLRLIKEEEPQKPSTRLSDSKASLPNLAAQRRTEPARLAKELRGELDWIVMKCLEKDRTRRYETANGLAQDIERHLQDEPVEACPPSARYKLKKLARRYKKPFAVAAAFMMLVVLGAVIAAWQAFRAMRAEEAARDEQFKAIAERDDKEKARAAAEKQKVRAEQAEALAKENEKRVREEKLLSERRFYASEMKLASLGWEAGQAGLVRPRLEELKPKRPDDEDQRGFEWHYLKRQCALDQRTLHGHASSVWGVAYSPDGRRIASVGDDGQVKVWDAATGQETLSLRGPAGRLPRLAFSPDGLRLASGGDYVKVWDAATGREIAAFRGHSNRVSGLVFSPDSRRVASAGEDGFVKVWEAAGGKVIHSLRAHPIWVFAVAFSPDGRQLASASMDDTLKLWDAVSGKEILSVRGAGHSVAFSPDGRRLSTSYGDVVKVWDRNTEKPETLTEVLGPKGGVFIHGHTGPVHGAVFSPDGRFIASASADHTVKVWDAASGRNRYTFRGHTEAVVNVAFSPDSRRLVSASWDKTVKIWDLANAQQTFTLRGHVSNVYGVAFGPDGRQVVSSSFDGTLKIWDTTSGQVIRSLRGHNHWLRGVAFSSDGRHIASASFDETVRIWDALTGQETRTYHFPGRAVWGVAFSPDGQRLATAGDADGTIKIWDVAGGQEILKIRSRAASNVPVAFSHDGQRIASSSRWGETVVIWDATTGKELLALPGHTGDIRAVAFSHDGRLLASASEDGTLKVWNTISGREVFTLRGHTAQVHGVAFSPDGRRIASGGDTTVRIWDAATGQETLTLRGHTAQVNTVAFSHDGKRLASASDDNTVRIWDATAYTRDEQVAREASGLVQFLFEKKLARTEAAAAIAADLTISEPLRKQTLAWLDRWWPSLVERDAEKLLMKLFPRLLLPSAAMDSIRGDSSLQKEVKEKAVTLAKDWPNAAYPIWQLVSGSGRPDAEYREALAWAETSSRSRPADLYILRTLGVAQYRTAKYPEAAATLLRCDQERKQADPGDLAFLAMAQYRLGQKDHARATLRRLQQAMKAVYHVANRESQALLKEAEQTIRGGQITSPR